MHAHHLTGHPTGGTEPSPDPRPDDPATADGATPSEGAPADVGPSDAELADAVRGGDVQAFATLWDRHAGAGRAAARRITSTYDPDDLLQEAFVRVLHALQSGAGPTGPFRPYLYTTLRAVAATWSRTPDPYPVDEVPEVVDERDATALVLERSVTARAFRRLPERWQTVLWYTEVEGMEPREAGPLLGLSASATAALAYRAREGLRREWLQAHVTTESVAPECRWTAERLGDHARGALPRAARDRVEDHLTGCLACSILAEEVDDVASRLRAVLLPLVLGVPAALGAAGTVAPVVAAADAAAVVAPTPDPAGSGAVVGAPGLVLGGVAAVVVAAVVGVGAVAGWWGGAPSGAAPVAGEAAPGAPAPGTTSGGAPVPAAPGDAPDGPAAPPGTDDPAADDDRAADGDPAPTVQEPGAGRTPAPTDPAGVPAPPARPSPAPTDPAPTDPSPAPVDPAPAGPDAPVLASAPAPGVVGVFPVLRGTGEPGAAVTVLDAGGAVVGAAVVGDDGTWEAVADGLSAHGEHTLRAVQEVDGAVSEPSATVGPYAFDLPVLLSPAPGSTVAGRPTGLPWEEARFTVDAQFSGTPGLVVEAVVDGRATGNTHALGDTPLVRQVSRLTLGEHTLGLRVVDPATGGHGPLVTSRFTVVR